MSAVAWKRTFYGWCAVLDGRRLSVRRYRAGDGRGFVYVARVDESAATSPAEGHRSSAAARQEAERMARPA
jgi:hypothetical protein